MDTKLQTGLLLVLGTIVSLVGWFAFYPADPTDAAAVWASKLIADSDMAVVGMVLGFGGTVALMIGLFNIARRMTMGNGSGSSYANVATILTLTTITLMVVLAGFEFTVAGGESVGAVAPVVGVAYAMNSTMPAILGLAVIALGVAIALEKTYQILNLPIVALLGVISGVIMIAAVVAENTDLQMFGWPLLMLTTLVLGVLRLRASD
jgi:hypothetical protein